MIAACLRCRSCNAIYVVILHRPSHAAGHVYERFLKIMMLAATKRSPSAHLHFWLVENFLSPQFKEFAPHLAKVREAGGCAMLLLLQLWVHVSERACRMSIRTRLINSLLYNYQSPSSPPLSPPTTTTTPTNYNCRSTASTCLL